MTQIKEILSNCEKELQEILKEENPNNFGVNVNEYGIEVGDYYKAIFEAKFKYDIENHLTVRISFAKKRNGKTTVFKPKKREYPCYQSLFQSILNCSKSIAKDKNLKGLIVIANDFDEKLSSFLEDYCSKLNKCYGQNIFNLLQLYLKGKLVYTDISKDLESDLIKFNLIFNTMHEVLDLKPLIKFSNSSLKDFAHMYKSESHVFYLGSMVTFKATDDQNNLIISCWDAGLEKTTSISTDEILHFLDETKEQLKLKHLLNKPMDNLEFLIRKISDLNLQYPAKIDIYSHFWIKEEYLSNHFESLEKIYRNWEKVEMVCSELIQLAEKKDYQFYEYAGAENTQKTKNVIMYEFIHQKRYVYFIFSRDSLYGGQDDELKIVVSETKHPYEVKDYLFDLLSVRK